MTENSYSAGASSSNRTETGTLLAFIVLVILGGSNVLAVRFSNLELAPFWGAALRISMAAIIFWFIMLIRRVRIPRDRTLYGTVVYGLLAFGASYACLYWGLLSVQAGVGVIILSLVPLLTILFSLAHGLEPFRWRALAGALLALLGIIIIVGRELGTTIPLPSLLALIAGSAFLAESSVLFKLFPKTDPVATNAIGGTTGAVFLILLSLLAQEVWQLPSTLQTWGPFAYLVVLGSVGVFYLYLVILSRWTASATSYAFLLFPIATILLAAWLMDETITPQFLLGGLIVLIGVWLGAVHQGGQMLEEGTPSMEPS